MKSSAKKIELASVDDLFSTEEGRQDAKLEKIQEIPLSELHPFKNHPFKVKDDEAMMETADSIKQYGVLVPAIARPDPEGGYELVAGHRRHRASELAEKETMPVIVRDLDDDAATIIMVDSNLQRESLLPSERAFAYKMKLEAMKHQGERVDLTCAQRYHILWAGVALMLLSVLLTLFTSMANDGSVWDFAYLTEQVIKNNMSMIFPMCISLIAGYMISREQTDDTLKNILTVPISFKKLLTGKLIVCGVLSIIFGLICSLFTIIAEMIVGFPGFEISLALKAALQITAVNFFLYLAVLPIIALTCRRAGSFLVGVIIAFVYGYGGMFAAGNMTLANLYPITASLGMVGYRSYDTAVNWNIGTCSCSLVLAVVISAILILCMKEREATQTKKKAKKVAPKKGW